MYDISSCACVAAGEYVVACIRARQGTCYDVHGFTSCCVFIGESTATCEVDGVSGDQAAERSIGRGGGITVVDLVASGDGTGDAFCCDVSSGGVATAADDECVVVRVSTR